MQIEEHRRLVNARTAAVYTSLISLNELGELRVSDVYSVFLIISLFSDSVRFANPGIVTILLGRSKPQQLLAANQTVPKRIKLYNCTLGNQMID